MTERAVARRILLLERPDGAEDEASFPFDTDGLRRYPDPREAVADELRVRERPVDGGVPPDGHVKPFEDGGAVELLCVDGPPNDNARLVRRCVAEGNRPDAIQAERRGVRICGCRAG